MLGRYFVAFFILVHSMIRAQYPVAFSLAGHWEYTQTPLQHWKKCQLPNSIYRILLEDQIIPDPFYSNNEAAVQWVAEEDWSFRKKFAVHDSILLSENIELEIEQLDTYAEVYLNNYLVGTPCNANVPQRLNIKPFLKSGTNEIIIHIRSAVRIADSLYRQLPSKLPGEMRVCLRKPQFHFGWDFGPKLAGCGIQGYILIYAWNNVRINHPAVLTKDCNADSANMIWQIEVESAKEAKYCLNVSIDQQYYAFHFTTRPGVNHYRFPFTIANPRLWWPNGCGSQHLYRCHWHISNENNEHIQSDSLRFGIRTIQLDTSADSGGRMFRFLINNKALFVKGANYIPQHAFQMSVPEHERIIDDIADCHFNMIRIWGGGLYEKDAFYRKCDEKGILIWQDFMYACGMYPGDSAFLENANREAAYQVQRLARYACIALWCGNNENNEGWHHWGWQLFLSKSSKDRIWNDYQNLFNDILPNHVSRYSNFNAYWESSPLYGRANEKFMSEGDAHDWGVWHDEMPFQKLEERIPRFMSEFGFQSLPGLQTILQFAGQSSLDLDAQDLLAHQKHPRGNRLIKQYIERDFPPPRSFDQLIYLNQLTQAEGIGLGILAHRRAKPYCMGTLYWQLNDCWPGISWSGRDFFGHWKALQHKTKEVFVPVLVQAKVDHDMCTFSLQNDCLQKKEVALKIAVMDFDGHEKYHYDSSISVAANQNLEIFRVDLRKSIPDFDATQMFLLMQWQTDGQPHERIQTFCKPSKLKLKAPEIETLKPVKTDSGWSFELRSNTFVKWVYLPEALGERFMPNFFDLKPNQILQVRWTTQNQSFQLKAADVMHLQRCLKP